jgi:hypothetical protein
MPLWDFLLGFGIWAGLKNGGFCVYLFHYTFVISAIRWDILGLGLVEEKEAYIMRNVFPLFTTLGRKCP